ncbi:hypothetical protein D3C85_1503930 [compost metagenome]
MAPIRRLGFAIASVNGVDTNVSEAVKPDPAVRVAQPNSTSRPFGLLSALVPWVRVPPRLALIMAMDAPSKPSTKALMATSDRGGSSSRIMPPANSKPP